MLRGAEADIVSLDGSLFGEDTPVTLDIAGDSYSRTAFTVRFGYA